jgi:hypothetical protein
MATGPRFKRESHQRQRRSEIKAKSLENSKADFRF